MKNTFLLLCLFSCSNFNLTNKQKANEESKRKRDIDDVGQKETISKVPTLEELSIKNFLRNCPPGNNFICSIKIIPKPIVKKVFKYILKTFDIEDSKVYCYDFSEENITVFCQKIYEHKNVQTFFERAQNNKVSSENNKEEKLTILILLANNINLNKIIDRHYSPIIFQNCSMQTLIHLFNITNIFKIKKEIMRKIIAKNNVKFLIDFISNKLYTAEKTLNNLLVISVKKGDVKCAEMLMLARANINQEEIIKYAVESGNINMIKFVVKEFTKKGINLSKIKCMNRSNLLIYFIDSYCQGFFTENNNEIKGCINFLKNNGFLQIDKESIDEVIKENIEKIYSCSNFAYDQEPEWYDNKKIGPHYQIKYIKNIIDILFNEYEYELDSITSTYFDEAERAFEEEQASESSESEESEYFSSSQSEESDIETETEIESEYYSSSEEEQQI